MNRIRKINTLVFNMAEYAINLSNSEVESKISEMRLDYENGRLPISLQIAVLDADTQIREKEAVIFSYFKNELMQIHEDTLINATQMFKLFDALFSLMQSQTPPSCESNANNYSKLTDIQVENCEYSLYLNEFNHNVIFLIKPKNMSIFSLTFMNVMIAGFSCNEIEASKEVNSNLVNYDIYREDIINYINHFNTYLINIENNSENITLTILKSYILVYYVRYSIVKNTTRILGISGNESLYKTDLLCLELRKIVENSDKFYEY